ncbi:MAG: hypothetical protein ACW99G_01530 [Candidatus Thorarchaeota archaeon]|jgi:NifU-like protein involved in Fe-S cluster formation
MHIIVKDRVRPRVKEASEEVCHRLWKIHKGDQRIKELDMEEMAAAQMLATRAMLREGVDQMTVQEQMEMIQEMTHAVNGDTGLAQRQVKAMLERVKRSQKAASYTEKNEAAVRAMLERKK